MARIITLCWATKKRHIAVDGHVLCEPKSINAGYSVKNGQFNSLALSGIPTNKYIGPDKQFSHSDGVIEDKPLVEQGIITKSICAKCLKKFNPHHPLTIN